MVKYLALLAIKHQFKYECLLIIGKSNVIADTLSRENDLKRNMIYNNFNKKYNIFYKIASKILNLTCIPKFCSILKI